MTSPGRDNDNRDFLRELYRASFAGEVGAFPSAMAPDFEAHVPPLLPWGGVHRGPDEFVKVVLPQLAAALDFGSMSLESISADGTKVTSSELAKKTGLPILVTGFRVEAQAMRDTLLRNFSVDARWVDDRAYDTFQNAQNSARLLNAGGVHKIILVTHATHLGRATYEFSAAGLDVVPAPAGMLGVKETRVFAYLPDAGALLTSQMAINEILGDPVRSFLSATHLRRH